MRAVSLILITAYRHLIRGANVEDGFEQFRAISGEAIDYDAFRNAIDTCLHDGLIREPVRLPEGALQCHWRLELTPKGVEAARDTLRAN